MKNKRDIVSSSLDNGNDCNGVPERQYPKVGSADTYTYEATVAPASNHKSGKRNVYYGNDYIDG